MLFIFLLILFILVYFIFIALNLLIGINDGVYKILKFFEILFWIKSIFTEN